MRNPFSRKKPEIPRNERGQFVVTPTAPATANAGFTPVKAAENEAAVVNTSLKTLGTGLEFLAQLDNTVKQRAEAMLAPAETEGIEEAVPSEWTPVIKTAIEILGPAIQPYVGGLIEKYLHVQPQNTQPTTAISAPQPPSPAASPPAVDQGIPQGIDFKKLIPLAAITPPTAMKPFMGQLREGLKNAGIDENEFKQACKNLSRAM